MATIKLCNKCGLDKDILNFNKNSKMKDKLSRICKECVKQIYVKNIDKIKEYQKNNSEKIKITKQKYWSKNKNQLNKNQKDFYSKNKNRLNAITKKYYENNRSNLIAYQKTYRKYNKEKVRATHRKNYKLRKKDNPSYKIRAHCSKMIYIYLRKQGLSKNKSSFINNLNYTIIQLKEHLETQFESWMNWSNWGRYNVKTWDDNDQLTWRWQIDHIIPQSNFSYTSMEDQSFKDCWALNNLRPYSAKQNWLDGISKVRHIK